MLKKLKLVCFRQHEDRTFEFTPGLNVIRGANEKGKSTLLEAIAYVIYGARTLRESLDDVVTWGQPASALRVELEFEYEGLTVVAKRGKSGAELLHGSTLVSGQDAVTKYFETLFKTNANVASQLQIATQNKVRGAIEGSGAVELIETLADFSILETYIDKLQAQKPNGNTKLVEDRITRTREAAEAPIPPEPSDESVVAAQAVVTEKTALYRASEALLAASDAALQNLQQPVLAARATVLAREKALALQAANDNRKAQVERLLAVPVEASPFTATMLDAWRQAKIDQSDAANRVQEHSRKQPTCAYEWDSGPDSFAETQQQNIKDVKAVNDAIRETELSIRSEAALAINEDSCAFCKKSLKDVPEVLAVNQRVSQAVSALQGKLLELNRKKVSLDDEHAAYAAIALTDSKLAAFPTAYWTHNTSKMPRELIWKGAPPSEAADGNNYDKMIRDAQASMDKAVRDQATMTAYQAELTRLKTAVVDIPDDTEAQRVIESEQAQQAQVKTHRKELSDDTLALERAEGALRGAKAALEHAKAMRQQTIDHLETLKQQLADAKVELAEMVFVNALIAKIRAARPVVANKLWALVLSAVSHYLTLGRNQPSTVTREGREFKVNGKGTPGLSGSALDSLGLAVRLALVKTFLPGSPFLILDEIAAACDDDRELHMLGMVLAADMPQVLLVTHSNAAESFAANLVQI